MEWVGAMVQGAISMVMAAHFTLAETFLVVLYEALPADWQANWDFLDEYRKAIEMWFPLHYTCELVLGYIEFWGTFVTVKMVLKITPFIG